MHAVGDGTMRNVREASLRAFPATRMSKAVAGLGSCPDRFWQAMQVRILRFLPIHTRYLFTIRTVVSHGDFRGTGSSMQCRGDGFTANACPRTLSAIHRVACEVELANARFCSGLQIFILRGDSHHSVAASLIRTRGNSMMI